MTDEEHMQLPEPGTLVGAKYRLIRLLGSGSTGAVFEANHAEINKRFAIKWLAQGDQATRDRMLHEARLCARIEHPNVVEVYDVGTQGDASFIVMELIEGETLEARLQRIGRFTVSEACELLVQIAQGLDAAHQAGVIHGDVKPSNVLLEQHTNIPKLADFGVARCVAEPEARAGSPAKVVGTVVYMPLELLIKGIADVRTDVYALAVVAFRVITGDFPYPPFPIINRIEQLTWLPVPSIQEKVRAPRALATAVKKAMAHKPDERFDSAAGFARSLEPFCDSGQISLRRRASFTRSSLRIFAAAQLGLLVVVLALFASFESKTTEKSSLSPTAKHATGRQQNRWASRDVEVARCEKAALMDPKLHAILETASHAGGAYPIEAQLALVKSIKGCMLDELSLASEVRRVIEQIAIMQLRGLSNPDRNYESVDGDFELNQILNWLSPAEAEHYKYLLATKHERFALMLKLPV